MSLLLAHYNSFVAAPTAARGVDDLSVLPALGEGRTPVVDIVIPVCNEVESVARCVRRLHAYLRVNLPTSFRITVADNASTDGTWAAIIGLRTELGQVAALRMPEKGRGRALRRAWAASDAQVLAYMDVDLSTDLDAVLPLLAPLISGHSDLAIGSRLARGARVVRGRKRDLISRCYNGILAVTLRARFSDAQCGFKAITAEAAQLLLPLVQDNGWFFDSELLVLAERVGIRIYEVPVDWIDDPDSRVDIVDTALQDLKGVWRVRRALASNQLPLADIAARLAAPNRPARTAALAGAK